MKRSTKTLLVIGGVGLVGAYFVLAKPALANMPARVGKTYTPPGATFKDQVAFCKASSRDPVIGQQCLAWLREIGTP